VPFALEVFLEQKRRLTDRARLGLRLAAQQRRRIVAHRRQATGLEKEQRVAALGVLVQALRVCRRQRTRLSQQTL
jgi:hypothetical protein